MRGPIAIGVILCGGACGCRGTPANGNAPIDASRPNAVTPGSSANIQRSVPPPTPNAEITACRAIAVDGDVRVEADSAAALDGGEKRLARLAQVANGAWLSLGPSARVVLKDPHTGRETTFLGPARARGCINGQGEAWVGAGRFQGELGGGEAPLAEEWVVTPLGVFRYVSAKVDIDVTPDRTTASVAGGTFFFWPADDAKVEVRTERQEAGAVDSTDSPWQRMSDGIARILPPATSSPQVAARHAVDSCSLRATRAEQLARLLLVRDASPPPTGETIAEQVRARRLAHASCGVARLRLELLPASVAREPLTKVLGEAEEAWSRLPLR